MNENIALIVGLGNPGPEYAQTRHNAGADFVTALVSRYAGQLRAESKFFGLYAKVSLAGTPIHCLIPTTYMNRSGRSVSAVANFFKIPSRAILVAHDELDIPPGTVKLKRDGGHGGHNGLRDIISHLGSKEFMRLRLGIGHPGDSKQVVNYVLKKASLSDQALIDSSIEEAIRLLPELINGNWHKAQTLMNGFRANNG